MKFAYKLQELRKGKGLSQEEFAELLGVSRQSVSKWESGRGYPEIDKLIYISNYFNTSLDLLLKGNDEDIFSTKGYKSKEDRQPKGKKIVLTKPDTFGDNDEVENVPMDEIPKRVKVPNTNYDYTTDPVPIKKKDSIPLKRLSIPNDGRLRTKYSYSFGSNSNSGSTNKKFRLSKHQELLVVILSGLILTSSIIGLVGYISTNSSYSVANTYEDTTVAYSSDYDYDYDEYFNGYYSQDCYNQLFLDDSSNGQLQKELIATSQNDIDAEVYTQDGNVYYTNLSVLSFYNASFNTLLDNISCSELYSLYKGVLDGSNSLVEVYSPYYDTVILISSLVLSTNYSATDMDTNVDTTNMYYSFNQNIQETIYSNPSLYYDDDYYLGIQTVRCLSLDRDVRVSYDILDTCYNDTYTLKHTLHAKNFVSEYERLSIAQNCEEVSYDERRVLVPKEYILVSVNEQDTNDQTTMVSNDTIQDGAVEQAVAQDDDTQ